MASFPLDSSRRQETILNRLRIEHTLMTDQHLMTKEEPPKCPTCGVQITVKHILTECRNFQSDREDIYYAPHIYMKSQVRSQSQHKNF